MLEVLGNGRSWKAAFGHDQHFQFGTAKAGMILAAMALISQFVKSNGLRPVPGRIIEVHEPSFEICCRCTNCVEDARYGPFMRLDAGKRLSFGMRKASALLQVESEIRAFVQRHHTPADIDWVFELLSAIS
jgi:hypothetical protein